MKKDLQKIIEQFVDFLLPALAPQEAGLYIFFLRKSYIERGVPEIRIGIRTIAEKIGASRSEKSSYRQIKKLVSGLEEKSCIKTGDTNRSGTSYFIFLPEEIPLVKEKLSIVGDPEEEDYFTNSEKRREIFERDKYTCNYCSEKVTAENATLDHLIPQSRGGMHTRENLKTSCLICNSIKSGKTFDEAAPLLLKNMQERRNRS